MEIKIYDFNKNELKNGSSVIIDSEIHLLYFGKYTDEYKNTHIGFYLTKKFKKNPVLSTQDINKFSNSIKNISFYGTIYTSLISLDDNNYEKYINSIRRKVIEEMNSDSKKFEIFLENDSIIEEIVQDYIENLKNNEKLSLTYYLENYGGYFYCPNCRKYKTSSVEKNSSNRHEFTLDYDEVCNNCFVTTRY